jgi:AI-2 transport protein TqsA
MLAKAMLVDVDPRARWADALLRASPIEAAPATPAARPPRRRRNGHAQAAAEPTT